MGIDRGLELIVTHFYRYAKYKIIAKLLIFILTVFKQSIDMKTNITRDSEHFDKSLIKRFYIQH